MTMKHKIVKKKKAVKKKLGRPLGSKNKPKYKPSPIRPLLAKQWEAKLVKESSARSPLAFNKLKGAYTEEVPRKNVFTIPLIKKLTGRGVANGVIGGNEESMSMHEVEIALPPGMTKEDFLLQYGPRGIVENLTPAQKKVNEREGHLFDALRYSTDISPRKFPLYHYGLDVNNGHIDASNMDPYKINPALRVGDAPPAHYAHGKIQPWDVIKDWKLDYFAGNATKYICRHEHKGKPVEDLEKAIDCLQERVKILKAQGLK